MSRSHVNHAAHGSLTRELQRLLFRHSTPRPQVCFCTPQGPYAPFMIPSPGRGCSLQRRSQSLETPGVSPQGFLRHAPWPSSQNPFRTRSEPVERRYIHYCALHAATPIMLGAYRLQADAPDEKLCFSVNNSLPWARPLLRYRSLTQGPQPGLSQGSPPGFSHL